MWRTYKNGNTITHINLLDGTKIRETEDDEFKPDYPDNLDIMISSKCSYGCSQCYAGCTPDGKDVDLLNYDFINTLKPYTEVALNLNSDIPDHFVEFLLKLKALRVIPNVTVQWRFLLSNRDFIDKLFREKLIFGLGVSVGNELSDDLIRTIQEYPTAVVHVINGIVTEETLNQLKNKGLKLLILGYKMKNRGKIWYEEDKENILKNQKYLYEKLPIIIGEYQAVCFDNLSLEQLEVKRLLTDEEYEEMYQGDDGSFTFAVDMVRGVFARDSNCETEYPILDSVEKMFDVIRKEKDNEKIE